MKNIASLELKTNFSAILMKWNRDKNDRQMPWKGEEDPYRIWLSEVILQQTRVDQGLSYYNNFISLFPDIHKLAGASDKKIFKAWEGLGYYSRCRNLMATARYISKERNGIFPRSFDEIIALKGIGPYSAAAISSFAFNLPHAVLDGNVYRVLARVFGIDRPIDTTEGRKYFGWLADQLLDQRQPGVYNQAIMDFGAVVCKPVSPLCSSCIFRKRCTALISQSVTELPVKEKIKRTRKRWFYFILPEYKNKIAIRKRTEKDIWQDLFEFPLIEMDGIYEVKRILREAERKKWISKKEYEVLSVSALFKQQLTHQAITGQFIRVKLKAEPSLNHNWIWVTKGRIRKYSFPRLINQYKQEILIR